MLTRVFRSGNSIAVRIPKELANVEPSQDVEIERVGDALLIRPVRADTLADVMGVFAQFSPGFMAEGREFIADDERDWAPSASGPAD